MISPAERKPPHPRAAYNKAYDAAHPEKLKARAKRYREHHPDRRRATYHAWLAANPEKAKAATKAWMQANKERMNALNRKWRKANPEKIDAIKKRERAKKRNAPGRGISASQWREIKASQCGLCAYCSERRTLTIEHIEPLSAGGAHDVDNVVAVCPACNCSKQNTPLLLWLLQR